MTMSDADEKGGLLAKAIGPTRRWREYKARVRRLPPDHCAAVEAIEQYMMHFVPTGGDRDAAHRAAPELA
ncbi:hypothetical protein DP939_19400 [Spongiactinospora rosea]|uniref:Uncharacterized protein n=1 Tax=Spongiactinospora rosea TaxID=2248750 RepID=A0A366LXJ4_9ACTN|nr:DUF1048 domain-containing protein [Spongiactinospora rosea]RBQ18651.1 hypothetical protein DP939_19400 [Spongiactinospora rosea]